MEIKSIETLFEEIPLSDSYSIKEFLVKEKDGEVLSFSKEALEKAKSLFNYGNHTATLPCIDCKDRSVFDFYIYEIDSDNDSIASKLNDALGLRFTRFSRSSWKDPTKASKKGLLVLAFEFVCYRHNEHHYQMVLQLELVPQEKSQNKALKITKVGQNPEPYVLKRETFEYAKALSSFGGKQDYLAATRSYHTGLFSGAYAYLRRTYEKLIFEKLKEKEYDPSIKEKPEAKIAKIKDTFDPSIQRHLLSAYKAISKGIHELTDEECKKHYLNLKGIIDIELEHIDSIRRREIVMKRGQKSITDINGDSQE